MTSRKRPPPLDETGQALDPQSLISASGWHEPQFGEVIEDRSRLLHSCYIELVPAQQKSKACWNDRALYFTERSFELVAPRRIKGSEHLIAHLLDREQINDSDPLIPP